MHKSLFVVSAVAVVLAAGTQAAQAKPVTAGLRVEAAGKTVEDKRFVTDTTTVDTDTRKECGGSGNPKTIQGPTGMGILASATSANRSMRPLGLSDKFPFGMTVCGIGRYVGFESNQFWLFKVNHKSPEVAADQYPLKPGDEVLWYFSDGAKNQNTGDELALQAPSRFTPGKPFTVTVYSYDFAGKRTPAAGAEVRGTSVQTADANGRATITIGTNSAVRLRASRGADIPAAPHPICPATMAICVAETITGRNVADAIKGTARSDRVNGRGGADRINVAGGGVDTVDCGAGKDVVVKDRRDRAAGNCERVVNRR